MSDPVTYSCGCVEVPNDGVPPDSITVKLCPLHLKLLRTEAQARKLATEIEALRKETADLIKEATRAIFGGDAPK